jgi:hypothetical protein
VQSVTSAIFSGRFFCSGDTRHSLTKNAAKCQHLKDTVYHYIWLSLSKVMDGRFLNMLSLAGAAL